MSCPSPEAVPLPYVQLRYYPSPFFPSLKAEGDLSIASPLPLVDPWPGGAPKLLNEGAYMTLGESFLS